METGALLSAVRADLVRGRNTYLNKTHQWTGPPESLADNAPCTPDGVAWLSIGFMNKTFYQRFAIIQNLTTPFILGMDFMIRASLTVHIPSRTVFIDDVPCPLADVEDGCALETSIEGGAVMSLDTLQSTLMAKVAEASLEEASQRADMFGLLAQSDNMCDGHLGRTSLTEHTIRETQNL